MAHRSPSIPWHSFPAVARAAVLALACWSAASPTYAQTPPDYAIEWRTIGAPGNRVVSREAGPEIYTFDPQFWNVGAVDYEYRLSRTEVKASQWYEFVQAYQPYWRPEQAANYVDFTSGWVDRTGPDIGGRYTYTLVPGGEDMPVDVGWRWAARFCNWLHNGKASGEWAFLSGAYDTSTFTQNTDGTFNDQRTHSPDAKFWIPSLDEWTKGMHWDPAKNNGEGGYWLYPTSSDVAPITGLPVSLGGDGTAETSAETRASADPTIPYVPVGQYPNVMSPWGLLDGSGGFAEWTELAAGTFRYTKGSSYIFPTSLDLVDRWNAAFFHFTRNGIRIASSVPAPGSILGGLLFITLTAPRRSRHHASETPCSHSVVPDPVGRSCTRPTRLPFTTVLQATIALTCGGVVSLGHAQTPPPDYGIEWRTIGAPGNRVVNAAEAPIFYQNDPYPPLQVGSVGYEFRMSRTEVTVGQYLEFVNAYAPYYTGSRLDPAFTGLRIFPTSVDPATPAQFVAPVAVLDAPADMGWRWAARFCNWLHNDKGTDRAAFESGAYDTSTFIDLGPPDFFQDQITHSPGAEFWIPSHDEWVKGVYYDPARYGTGQGGYWMFPNGTDSPLTPGLPGEPGAQTSAGIADTLAIIPVGAYPDVQTPWGLLDASGGVGEWTETVKDSLRRRYSMGTDIADFHTDLSDRLGRYGANAFVGLRLASSVPNPGVCPAVLVLFLLRRSRRCSSTLSGSSLSWSHARTRMR
jgi:formylglycine-generating enzyme required for sulfatase activity